MKKVLFAMAIAGMFGFAACNNNKAAEEVVDTPMETVEENTQDTTTMENAAEETAEVATEEAAQ